MKVLRLNFLTGLTVFGRIKIWDQIRVKIRNYSVAEPDLFHHSIIPIFDGVPPHIRWSTSTFTDFFEIVFNQFEKNCYFFVKITGNWKKG